jgi:hypothetical protein
MLLFHCAERGVRDSIRCNGLKPTKLTHRDYVFAWPTLDSAHEWRKRQPGGWKDIWAFDDGGESIESPGGNISSAGDIARALPRAVPPEDLELVYEAR